MSLLSSSPPSHNNNVQLCRYGHALLCDLDGLGLGLRVGLRVEGRVRPDPNPSLQTPTPTLTLALTLTRLGHVLLDELETVARAEDVEAASLGQTPHR